MTKNVFTEGNDLAQKRSNFFIDIINSLENFSFISHKNKKEKKKIDKAEIKENEQALKESETTIDDIANERKNYFKKIFLRVTLFAIVAILVSSAVILAFQDNEQITRENLNVAKKIK